LYHPDSKNKYLKPESSSASIDFCGSVHMSTPKLEVRDGLILDNDRVCKESE